jgi:hypothetical protein
VARPASLGRVPAPSVECGWHARAAGGRRSTGVSGPPQLVVTVPAVYIRFQRFPGCGDQCSFQPKPDESTLIELGPQPGNKHWSGGPGVAGSSPVSPTFIHFEYRHGHFQPRPAPSSEVYSTGTSSRVACCPCSSGLAQFGVFGEAESARCFDHRGFGLVLRIVSGDRQSGHDVRAPHASARGVGRCGHRARRHSRIVLCSDCSRDLGCRRTSSPAPAVLHCDRGCGLVRPHGSAVAEVAADHIALGRDGRIQAGDASDAGLRDTRRTYRPGGSRGSAAEDVAPVGLAAGVEAMRLTGSGTMLRHDPVGVLEGAQIGLRMGPADSSSVARRPPQTRAVSDRLPPTGCSRRCRRLLAWVRSVREGGRDHRGVCSSNRDRGVMGTASRENALPVGPEIGDLAIRESDAAKVNPRRTGDGVCRHPGRHAARRFAFRQVRPANVSEIRNR